MTPKQNADSAIKLKATENSFNVVNFQIISEIRPVRIEMENVTRSIYFAHTDAIRKG